METIYSQYLLKGLTDFVLRESPIIAVLLFFYFSLVTGRCKYQSDVIKNIFMVLICTVYSIVYH